MVRHTAKALLTSMLAVAALTVTAVVPTQAKGVVHPVKISTAAARHIKESNVRLYMAVITGKMLNKAGWPAFVPGDFVVPAHTLVTVVIRNFDGGTAPLQKGMLQYDKVTGTVGNIEELNDNAVVSAVLNKNVSHTFTIAKLHLNAPIPAGKTVEFTFRTPGPGTYTWQCMAPCGTGSGGWAGPMSTNGWMTGKMVVKG